MSKAKTRRYGKKRLMKTDTDRLDRIIELLESIDWLLTEQEDGIE